METDMMMTTINALTDCVDWAACEAEFERDMAEEELLLELAESEAEEHAMDGYYRGRFGD